MCLKDEEIVNTIVTPFTREGAVLAAKIEDLIARYAMKAIALTIVKAFNITKALKAVKAIAMLNYVQVIYLITSYQ